MQPHRGVLILIFGILGFLVCPIFAPVAWMMGRSDLQEIEAGRMDPEGKGLTQAGMILGIIQSLLVVLTIVGFLIVLVFFGAAVGLQS